jgi:hypothetical protein
MLRVDEKTRIRASIGTPAPLSDAANPVTEWIGASPKRRSEALLDLFLLADALPPCSVSPDEVGLGGKIIAIHQALDIARIPHALGGAFALAYYGEPRMTTDIDLNAFVPTGRWTEVRDALQLLGIYPADDAPDRKGQIRFQWGETPIDVFLSHDPLHAKMPRAARDVPFADIEVPIVAPEHLIVRKAIIDRPKDWLDIEQIFVATDPLDLAEIEAWLEEMVGEDNPRMKRLREILVRLGLDEPGSV